MGQMPMFNEDIQCKHTIQKIENSRELVTGSMNEDFIKRQEAKAKTEK